MVYPTINSNAKSFNLVSLSGYSPYYDIVWSFDYAISGNNNTEAGLVVFLKDFTKPNIGGNAGIDLGYSGLSSYGMPYSIKTGISGAVLGVGLDTTGLFSCSATIGGYRYRDGIDSLNRIQNSVSIRSGSLFEYATESYLQSLSSLDSTFNIVASSTDYKTIRARLGNIGRTFYLDYRNNPNEDFKPLLEKDVSLNFAISSLYNVGVSFSTPVSSNNSNTIGNIFIRNFHSEGKL